jgi:hypothetical protein
MYVCVCVCVCIYIYIHTHPNLPNDLNPSGFTSKISCASLLCVCCITLALDLTSPVMFMKPLMCHFLWPAVTSCSVGSHIMIINLFSSVQRAFYLGWETKFILWQTPDRFTFEALRALNMKDSGLPGCDAVWFGMISVGSLSSFCRICIQHPHNKNKQYALFLSIYFSN